MSSIKRGRGGPARADTHEHHLLYGKQNAVAVALSTNLVAPLKTVHCSEAKCLHWFVKIVPVQK